MLLGAFGTVITRMLQQKEEPQLATGSPSPPLPPFIPLFFPCLILSLIHKQALLSCLVLAPRVASPAPAPAPTASAFLATVPVYSSQKIKHKLHPGQNPAWFVQLVKLLQNVGPEGDAWCHQNTHREFLVLF